MAGADPLAAGLPADPALRTLARETADVLLDRYPMWATDLGLASRDHDLGDLSRTARDAHVRRLTGIRRGLADIDPSQLSADDAADREILLHAVDLAIDDDVRHRVAAWDPTLYNGYIAGGLLSLARRRFGSPERRAKAAQARLAAVPALLDAALKELDNPPGLFVDLAEQEGEALIRWLEGAFARAFGLTDSGERMLADAADEAAGHLRRYLARLADPARRASGNFRIGSDRLQERLTLQEHGEWDLVRLLQRGYDELNRERDTLARCLAEIRCDRTPVEEVTALRQDKVPDQDLARQVRTAMDDLAAFFTERQVMDLIDDERPRVDSASGLLFATAPLELIHPGPFDPPGPSVVEVRPDDTLYRWALPLETARATLGGRYLLARHVSRHPRTLRRLLPAAGLVGGFPAYSVALLVEEGYFQQDARYRVAVVLSALEQAGRLIVAIRLHADDMTLDEAAQFLVDQCFLTRTAAEFAAIEAALHPLSRMTLAQEMALRELREDVKQLWRGQFSLRRFHDALLAHGFAPIPILRQLIDADSSHRTNIGMW